MLVEVLHQQSLFDQTSLYVEPLSPFELPPQLDSAGELGSSGIFLQVFYYEKSNIMIPPIVSMYQDSQIKRR